MRCCYRIDSGPWVEGDVVSVVPRTMQLTPTTAGSGPSLLCNDPHVSFDANGIVLVADLRGADAPFAYRPTRVEIRPGPGTAK